MIFSHQKGLKRALLYYVIGMMVCFIFHLTIGWRNKALMPPSMLIIVLLILISLPWSLLNALGLRCPVKRNQNSAELLIHLIAFLITGLVIQVNILN